MTPNKEGGASWLVVAGISVMQLSLLPIAHCFGLIYEREFQEIGMSTVAISLLIHTNSGVASIFGLLSAPLLRQYSFRIVAVIGCASCGISICLMSLAKTWITYMVTFSFLLGIGQGFLYTSTTLALSSHFKKKRSLAVGITVLATSVSQILSPFIVTYLIFTYGTSGTVLMLGGVSLHSIAGALFLRPPPSAFQKDDHTREKLLEMKNTSHCTEDNPEMKENAISNTERPTTPVKIIEKTDHQPFIADIQDKVHSPTPERWYARMVKALDLDLLKDPIYVNIAMGMGISIASEYNFHMLLPFILVDMANLDKHALATILSVQASADIVARIVFPLLANWLQWNARCGYIASLLGAMLGRAVLAHFHHDYKIILVQAVIFGIFKGLRAVFQSLVLPNYVPLEKLAAASGLYMILNGILSLICGPIVGFVRDSSDSYVIALYTTTAISFLCIFSWAAEYFYKKQRKEEKM